jgi:hypothetical protein
VSGAGSMVDRYIELSFAPLRMHHNLDGATK